MACTDSKYLYRRLERDFNVVRAIPAARAALGLMAVLRTWVAEGHAGLVALSACVCHDVVAAVLGAGCTPVFCDIDPINGEVFSHEWERARAAGASVALVVHLYGNPVEISLVRRYFSTSDCLIIDDAAQALGSKNIAGYVGGQGDVGLLSFGSTKHIQSGGAAVLFKDSVFAESVTRTLVSIEFLPEQQRLSIYTRFREKFETARRRLRCEGTAAAGAFDGILAEYYHSLQLPFPMGSEQSTFVALNTYAKAREQRIKKSATWATGLVGSGLIPIGMGAGSVPWRYTCRLPGITWNTQHKLGEEMRSHGINVSHWYLPAHWMCGYGPWTLPGTERFAQEVFQFWVDDQTSSDDIVHGANSVSRVLRALDTFANCGMQG